MTAVRHQLARKLACQEQRARTLRPLVGIAANRELGERDCREKPPFPLRVLSEGAHEVRACAREMLHEAAIEIQPLAYRIRFHGDLALLVDDLATERLQECAGGIDGVCRLAEADAERKTGLVTGFRRL